ncbi:MAG: hypothetical protein ACE5PO_00055 [Candidatus Bathyarchaeia archaeon]
MEAEGSNPSDSPVSLMLTSAEAEILDRLLHMCFSTIFAEKANRDRIATVVLLKEDKEIDTLWEIWRKLQVKIIESKIG